MTKFAMVARFAGGSCLTFLLFTGSALATPTLLVSAGILTGARSVLVGGVAYDVEFVEGTCASVFGGCDALADFDFSSSPTASAASQALLDQVFADGTDGSFDADPSKTFGCVGGAVNRCFVYTPYAFGTGTNVNASAATNNVLDSADGLGGSSIPPSFDSSLATQNVWARWTRSATTHPLPEPATLSLLAAAGLALAGLRRRPHAAAS